MLCRFKTIQEKHQLNPINRQLAGLPAELIFYNPVVNFPVTVSRFIL
jgi:hypothetical protein